MMPWSWRPSRISLQITPATPIGRIQLARLLARFISRISLNLPMQPHTHPTTIPRSHIPPRIPIIPLFVFVSNICSSCILMKEPPSSRLLQKWKTMLPKWQARLPVGGTDRSWLDLRKGPSGWGFGCTLCRQAATANPTMKQGVYAQFKVTEPHMTNFKKHRSQPCHLRAVQFNHDQCKDVMPAADLCEFESALQRIRDGNSVLKSKKQFKLAWCLYQAMKVKDLAALRKYSMICLFRDERKTRVAVSARLISADLETRCVSLGAKRELGTGAREITTGTYNIIKDACTLYDTPGRNVGVLNHSPVVHWRVLNHIRQKIRAICVDSASDELLSCEMMRSATLMGPNVALCPKLSMVLRDKAHASRRITSRPWIADPYLNETLHMFCRGRPSATRIVLPHNNRVFLFEEGRTPISPHPILTISIPRE